MNQSSQWRVELTTERSPISLEKESLSQWQRYDSSLFNLSYLIKFTSYPAAKEGIANIKIFAFVVL